MSTPSADLADRLLAWFDRAGRHDLPWQHPRTPYRVWLSEIMLQQTQVRVVIPYFERFVAALPDVRALAAAPLDQVLALWSGLGYYARARHLHAAARLCVERHDGELPRDFDALAALPGIGRSTAGAILAQAWGERFPILDGNVKRVLARLHGIEGWPGLPAVEKRLWALAEAQLPHTRLADYTQAQMDFGATLCTRFDPACVICPLQDRCVALREGRVDELPTPKPGKPLPERRAIVLWIEDGAGRVLLQRRPPAGIWAALWSLPEHPDHDAARHWLARRFDLDFDRAEPLAPVAHGFTHYRLQLQPLRWRAATPRPAVGDEPDLRWVAPSEFAALGIPAPIRRLLAG
ncbi:A/G-specific adenine glycosylase [Vulcaniibacterium gelatinicum]|uniref:A/G-specific adenine glycosylase n=1 Tax=Vulcaniibacterium gelatinicum TaxID=2598725 RepID=UPI0011CC9EDC|nr:A/G-specific adenine glycosylase [Vulcaniibacterium gelatinicum]